MPMVINHKHYKITLTGRLSFCEYVGKFTCKFVPSTAYEDILYPGYEIGQNFIVAEVDYKESGRRGDIVLRSGVPLEL